MDLKRKLLKLAAIIASFGLISVVIAVSIFIWMFTIHQPDCELGPLTSIQSCKKDNSNFAFQNSGWWYSYAQGPLDEKTCSDIKNGKNEITFAEKSRNTKILAMDCLKAGFSSGNTCFGLQKLSSNGNAHYLIFLKADDCSNAVYFKGSNAEIVNGEPEEKQTHTYPHAGVPELDKN